MYTLLTALIGIISFLLILIVLLQSGKGGGLAAEFGGASSSTDSFMGGRQTANFLTRATWYGGGAFLVLALLLAVLSARQSTAPESILRQDAGQRAAPPASVLETEGQGTQVTPVPVQVPAEGETGAPEENPEGD